MVRSRCRNGMSGWWVSLIGHSRLHRGDSSLVVWFWGVCVSCWKGQLMLKVKSMAFNELVKAKARIEAELELRAAKERSRLIEAIGRLRRISAKSNGVGAGRPHALKGKKLPPLYRNPKNRSETWAGRGNRPRWLVAALKGGKKLEAFAIK